MAEVNEMKNGKRITIKCFTTINSNEIRIGRKIAEKHDMKET
jgi:hypothetical protein